MRRWTEKEKKRQACVLRRHKPWKKSTGPRTAQGKEKSKYNATKHGSRSAAFIRLRKALAAQGAYLKLVKDRIKYGEKSCSQLKSFGNAVTNELLSAMANFEHP